MKSYFHQYVRVGVSIASRLLFALVLRYRKKRDVSFSALLRILEFFNSFDVNQLLSFSLSISTFKIVLAISVEYYLYSFRP
jgi:hypothetical protein